MRYEYIYDINDDISLYLQLYMHTNINMSDLSIEIIGDSRYAAAARTHGAQSSKYKYDVYKYTK